MDHGLLAALAEVNRLRIVELLNYAPRSVGEIAAELGLRQPQATKHLQTLERAGLVTVHPLGQRRIYALRRDPLRELRQWLKPFEAAHPSEDVLGQYSEAMADERAQAARDPDWAIGRTVRLSRELRASASDVWAHWTSATLIRRWWSPEHFDVAECEIDPVVNGILRIVMQEHDGSRYLAHGRFLALAPPERLRFELSHIASDDTPLFTAIHDVRLNAQRNHTQLTLGIRITAAIPAAAPALAGMKLGWQQLLDKLARALAIDHDSGQ